MEPFIFYSLYIYSCLLKTDITDVSELPGAHNGPPFEGEFAVVPKQDESPEPGHLLRPSPDDGLLRPYQKDRGHKHLGANSHTHLSH